MSQFKIFILDREYIGRSLRFTLGWNLILEDGRVIGDNVEGCLAHISRGEIVWSFHRTVAKSGYSFLCHHPTPDLVTFVKQTLDKTGSMKPLQERYKKEQGLVEKDTIEGIIEEIVI